jgi:hypothetical protein
MCAMNAFRFLLSVSFLLILILSACRTERETSIDFLEETDLTLNVADATVTVLDAQLRNSVQTHYLMHYPEPDHTYLEVLLTIDGLVASPENILAWGTENTALQCDGTSAELTFPRRVIADENVEYKVGEEINFHYVYIYSVLRDADFETCHLIFSDGQRVNLSPKLEGFESPEETALPEEKGVVLSGDDNRAFGESAVVGGGAENSANAIHTTVSGGNLNLATASHATVAGGRENAATDFYAMVGGGYANIASARDTFVGGGSRNIASGPRSTVGGGIQNQAAAPDTIIAGGAYNQATDDYAFVGGGTRNLATGYASVIGGGAGNAANNDQAIVAGGLGNQVDGKYGSVGGGYGNLVSGDYATIPGGFENMAAGENSFAAGQRASIAAEHFGTFIFADASGTEFRSEFANEFAVRATGGVRIISAVSPEGEIISGVQLPPGSGSWTSLSDRSTKTGFSSVNPQEILATVVNLPISEWRYKGEAESVRHIGPISQDFFTAFGLGDDARYISVVDADGVALTAIQGMYALIQQQDALLQEQDARMAVIERRLADIEQNSQPSFAHWLGWLLLVGLAGWCFGLRGRSYISGLSRRNP